MNIYKYNKHFLDSNIILRHIIQWDYLSDECRDYFERKWSRNTSKRVYDECEGVIVRYRRLQGNFLESFKEYLNGINQDRLIITFDNELDRFVSSFIRKNLKKKDSFNLPQDKFKNSVRNFANEYRYSIRDALISSTYDSLILECRSYFNETINELENICYDSDIVKTIPHVFETYTGHYPQYEKKLKDIGIHSPDDKIILDCYYFIETEFKDDTAFVTNDKTILNASSQIESLLKRTHVHSITNK